MCFYDVYLIEPQSDSCVPTKACPTQPARRTMYRYISVGLRIGSQVEGQSTARFSSGGQFC